MAIEFITTRNLENKNGEITGKVRIAKMKEEDKAMVDFTCPMCDHTEKKEEDWTEPFVTGKGAKRKMYPICSKCGHKVTVLKLRKQIAKEKKKNKKR